MHLSATYRNGLCSYVRMIFTTQLIIYWQADAQTAIMYPPEPAYVDIKQQRTFMCKTTVQNNWRSTSFYDETNSGGVPSVGLFYRGSTGCQISAVSSTKYNASCDSSKGEFNLTILSVDGSYHNKSIRCQAQYGVGSPSDVFASASTVIFVRVPITDILISNTSITSDVTRDITIECIVKSRPAASISWIIINSEGVIQNVSPKSSTTVTSDVSGIITLTSQLTYQFKASDNGAFLYCSADNTITSRNSTRVSLNIYYPPLNDPVIQQIPNGPINISEAVVLTCSVSGGFPLAVLTWNCSGNATNNTSGNTVYYSIGFMLVSQDNGKTCTCSATHTVTAYRPQVHIMLNVYFPPTEFPVIKQIPDGPVLTDSLVSLMCTLKGGNPLATLTWNCTGIISTNSSQTTAISYIELPVTKLNHGMVCTCSAFHNTDSYMQPVDHVLNIIFPPDERPKVRQYISGPIDTGTSVKLICSVTGGNPLGTLSWDCPGINSNNSTANTAVLEVEFTVDKNYNGRNCSCSTTHPVATYRPKTSHELVVYFPPSKPILFMTPEMPWFIGNTTEVQCSSTEGNPESTFEWKKDDIILNVNESELTLGPLTKHDNMKTITCTVSNEYTERQSIILASDGILLNVEYFPEITIDKFPVHIMEGNNATIVCSARGNPVPKVQWFQQDHNITEFQMNQSVLHLFNVDRLLDGMLYSCKAMSSSNRFDSLTSENTTKAIVYYSPNITNLEVLNGQTVSENEDVKLRCGVDSNPLSTITWRFVSNQNTLQKQDDVSFSNYIIPKIQCVHMGTYQCQATNKINETTFVDTKDITVYVLCSPRVDTRIQGFPKLVAVEHNGDLNLTVYLIAYPTPTIRWIYKNEVASVSSLVGNVYVSNLHIPHLKQSMFGEYTVHAFNDNGNLFLHVNVVPKGKPTPPSNVFVVCKTTSATIFWKPEFDGGDKQTFEVKYWKTSQVTTLLSTTPVTDLAGQSVIEQLLSGFNYSFVLQTSNIYGTSNATLLTCETDVKEPTTDSVRWNLTSAAERHDVSCLSDSISVFIPSDLLSHYQTTWRDPHCQVQDNGTHYVSTISHTSCGTTVIFTKDEVIFENELILHKSGSPSNQTSNGSIDFGSSDSEVIPVQCIYPRRQNISTLYRPAQSTVRFYEKRYGHMDVQLEQYKSGMFVTPLPVRSFPNEVEINKDMYFILHAMHVNSTDVAVKVDSCVATPSNIPADGRIYQLLDQGCPASPAVKVYPSAFDEVRFSVRAFEFRTSPGGIVYIHCQVSVCSPTSPQCRVGCAHRHRREVSTEDGGSHLVSGGPYLLVADKGGLQVSTVVAGVCASVAVVATVIAIIGWRRKSSASTSNSKL